MAPAKELVTLAPGVHYLPGAVNVVVLEDGQGGALLVDSGSDADHGRRILRALEARGLQLNAVLNTHSHADHYGGNAFLESRCAGLPVFAPPLEEAILRYPLLEPLYLFGARPPQELQNKFLMGNRSEARLTPPAGPARIGGVELELIEVPGHAARMFAVRAGSVLFASDALFGSEALNKHPLTYCVDSALQKASARKLADLSGVEVVLPGHGEPTTELGALVRSNLASLERTTEAVHAALEDPATPDEVLARVCDRLGVEMKNAAAVVLNRGVISAHLVELLEAGRAASRVEGNRWLWQQA
ncbi:glyoxylase-like metal-dependent hydrolase (beta-lactamase superfamily II) [Deinobacterium chartae]|uniref:Glyoxylase-like metal-dependent hydrolase (Beta-lactamase superfamily II) n=1 Tax=Deinobacterium chartae TaxID=521158 RepID=A0A841I4E9_9DEIO|nr:MBL fold metallo-hydrolase [Deinobacterium chartae]MBB6099169.1 glyoxylase-like metal-dependent hydrolase (beta-lactamase superfamily II) [Deinobacterium chartae]